MDEYIDSVELAVVIARYFRGEMTEDEELRFRQWLAEDPANAALLEEFKKGKNIAAKMRQYDHYDPVRNWKEVQRRIRGGNVWLYRLPAAAAVLLLLLGGSYWFLRSDKSVMPPAEVIVAGGHKARLLTNDGTVVNLDTLVTLSLDGVRVAKDDKAGLIYAKNVDFPGHNVVPGYHQLCVPRGGEYDLLLEDGTRVWLNADSKLRFPVVFGGKERKVFLEGEAYFAVSRDTMRPFRVVAEGQMLEVLGTEFNVNAYREEEQVYTTLVEGKVKVRNSEQKEVVLLPGEQAILEVNSGQLVKKRVYVEEFVGWKKGRFVFEDQSFEQIMRQLARWYDFQVSYVDESLKKVVFQGNIARYEDFGKVLKLLERTGEMKFEVRGKTVVVDK